MSIEHPDDLEGRQRAGAVVRDTLAAPRSALRAEQVITIEAIIAAGSGEVFKDRDGWTSKTVDGNLGAHVEHTLIVTAGAPQVVTA